MLDSILPGVGSAIGQALRNAAIAATSSAVSQGVGVATGIQEKFSFKAVGQAALFAGNNPGAASVGNLKEFGAAFARGAVNNAVNQGVAVATGLQSKFSFAAVAAAGVSFGVNSAAGSFLQSDAGQSFAGKVAGAIGPRAAGYAIQTGVGAATAIANAATRSLIQGTSFGDNLIAALPDVIGQTIGNGIADGIIDRFSSEGGDASYAYDTSEAEALLEQINALASGGALQNASFGDDAYALIGRFFEGLEIDGTIFSIVAAENADLAGIGKSLRGAAQALELLNAPQGLSDQIGYAAALYEGVSTGSTGAAFDAIGSIYGLGKSGVGFAEDFASDPTAATQRLRAAIDARAAQAARAASDVGGQIADGSLLSNIGGSIQSAIDTRVLRFATTAANGNEAAFNEFGRDLGGLLFDIGSAFLPIGKAGKVAQDVGVRSAIARRGLSAATRTALGEILPSVLAKRGPGRYGLTEARGIVYAAREAGKLGFDLIGDLTFNKSGHGADLLFSRTGANGAREFAIFEAKGGYKDRLGSSRYGQQGSSSYNEAQLENFLRSEHGRANPGLSAQVSQALRSPSISSYTTSYRGRSIFEVVSSANGRSSTKVRINGGGNI